MNENSYVLLQRSTEIRLRVNGNVTLETRRKRGAKQLSQSSLTVDCLIFFRVLAYLLSSLNAILTTHCCVCFLPLSNRACPEQKLFFLYLLLHWICSISGDQLCEA